MFNDKLTIGSHNHLKAFNTNVVLSFSEYSATPEKSAESHKGEYMDCFYLGRMPKGIHHWVPKKYVFVNRRDNGTDESCFINGWLSAKLLLSQL